MLQNLIEFFLLLSSDKKTITSNNLSTFYQFITKKLPEIDNHRPNLIIYSLNKKNFNYNDKDKIHNKDFSLNLFKSQDMINKANKNVIFNNFQNELLDLFKDMIDYLYEEHILILSNDKKVILNNKINKKLKENNIIISKSNSTNNILIKDIKIKEIRNYIIELIKDNNLNEHLISLNFTIKHFVNFFNTKNKDKNINIVKQFIDIINPIIKIYKTDQKIFYYKKYNKNRTKSLSKIPNINVDNNNALKDKKTKSKKLKNNNINKYFYRINNSFNNNRDKDKFNINNIFIKNNKKKLNYKKNNIITKKHLKEQNNSTRDTIPCQTLNNFISFNNIQKNSLIENYLSNNLTKSHNIFNKYKDNNNNSKKIVINKIKNFHSKSQINNFNSKNYCIKSKSTITSLYNKDFTDFNEKIWKYRYKNFDDFDDFNIGKSMERKKNNITSLSRNDDDDIKDKNMGCLLF